MVLRVTEALENWLKIVLYTSRIYSPPGELFSSV